MICDILVADWNKIGGVITSVGTIVALVFSTLTLRQTSAYRREDQRDRLLGALIEQLTVLRSQQQRVSRLRRDLDPSFWEDAQRTVVPRALADQLADQLEKDVESVLTLHRSISSAVKASSAQLREWRATIDQHGSMLPQVELQIDELDEKGRA